MGLYERRGRRIVGRCDRRGSDDGRRKDRAALHRAAELARARSDTGRLIGVPDEIAEKSLALNVAMHWGQAVALGAWRSAMASGGLRGIGASTAFTGLRLLNDGALHLSSQLWRCPTGSPQLLMPRHRRQCRRLGMAHRSRHPTTPPTPTLRPVSPGSPGGLRETGMGHPPAICTDRTRSGPVSRRRVDPALWVRRRGGSCSPRLRCRPASPSRRLC
jgi:hypothetical protein